LGQRGRDVFEGEKGVGEMIKGLAYTVGCRHGKEDVVAAVVGDCRGEVKSPSPMFCP
jgi:hypothetical protein